MGHNRSKVSRSRAEIEVVHANFPRSSLSLMSKSHESGWLNRFEVGELFPDLGFFKTNVFTGILNAKGGHFQNTCLRDFEKGWQTFFQNVQNKIFRPFKMSSY